MAKRIIVQYITDCEGQGCDNKLVQLADGTPTGKNDNSLVPKLLPDEPRGYTEVKIFNNRKVHLCPDCYEKLKGVFKADAIAPVVPEPAQAQGVDPLNRNQNVAPRALQGAVGVGGGRWDY
jgi:hypothetical protein